MHVTEKSLNFATNLPITCITVRGNTVGTAFQILAPFLLLKIVPSLERNICICDGRRGIIFDVLTFDSSFFIFLHAGTLV